MTNANATATIEIPYLLDFGPAPNTFRPGSGRAGWTVASVPVAEAAAFIQSLPPASRCPGTIRVWASLEGGR